MRMLARSVKFLDAVVTSTATLDHTLATVRMMATGAGADIRHMLEAADCRRVSDKFRKAHGAVTARTRRGDLLLLIPVVESVGMAVEVPFPETKWHPCLRPFLRTRRPTG